MSKVLKNIDVHTLITEDDEPVDNIFSEKQQRLLTTPLYDSWQSERKFLALANVGIFTDDKEKPIVPDMMLSMDVELTKENWPDEHRSYLMWEFEKAPEIVIEVVSNNIGKENSAKKRRYAQIGVFYYVIFDPILYLSKEPLIIYQLADDHYIPYIGTVFPNIGLGLKQWFGTFQDEEATWLRWTDLQGSLILTGAEQADLARQQTDLARQQADLAHQQADLARQQADLARQETEEQRLKALRATERADLAEKAAQKERNEKELLMAKLRALGIDPNQI